jgi:hypothetical protein
MVPGLAIWGVFVATAATAIDVQLQLDKIHPRCVEAGMRSRTRELGPRFNVYVTCLPEECQRSRSVWADGFAVIW